MTFYETMYRLFAGMMRTLYRVRVTGAENEPMEGPCLICANHTSMSDVIILSAVTHRRVRYMAKAELFRIPIISKFLSSLGAYSVRRGQNDVGSIKRSVRLLSEGELVCIFPQGARKPKVDPRTTDVYSGAAMIASRAHADVLPVYIKTKGNRTRLLRRTEVIFGRRIPYDEYSAHYGDGKYTDVIKYIFNKICELDYESSTPEIKDTSEANKN